MRAAADRPHDDGRALVDGPEDAGLVERQRNPDHRRAYALEATDAGRKWLAGKHSALMAAQDELLSVLGDEERPSSPCYSGS